MAQLEDLSFAHFGGFAADDVANPHSMDDDLAGILPNPSSVMRFHPSSIASSDFTGDGLEDERRPRFQQSLYSESSAASSASYEDNCFSSLHDSKTKASRTTSGSQAIGANNAPVLDPVDEVPEVVTIEAMAPANISAADHWNQIGVEPTITGIQASSATAMASWRGRPGRPTISTDATEIVAHLPCEFQWYQDCKTTFPLHRSEAGIDAWADHMVRHMSHRYPKVSGCWFCDEKFAIHEKDYSNRIVAMAVYKKRLKHIARHYLQQGAQASAAPRRDADFEAHLIASGICEPPAGPSGQARVAPAMDYTTVPKRIRSTRPEARYITEVSRRTNGVRRPPLQVVHNQ
ncbi:hypothetical protein V2A60_001274 [Cordyceps javanica]